MDIPTNIFTEGLAAYLAPWVAGALGIGIALLAIYRGWAIVRDLATGGGCEPADSIEVASDGDNDKVDEDEEAEEEQ
jgi:hypothetical protein